MSNRHASVPETVKRLEELRAAARHAAEVEQRLNLDFRLKTTAASKRLADSLEATNVQLARELAQADADFAAAQAAAEAAAERRKARIAKAEKASRARVLERIELEEGRRKYNVQKGMIDLERSRDETLAAAEATFKEFSGHVEESRATLAQLEAEARLAFRGYRAFARQVDQPAKSAAPDLSADEYALFERFAMTVTQASEDLGRFRRQLLPAVFRRCPLWVWIVLILGGAAFAIWGLPRVGGQAVAPNLAGGVAGGALVALLASFFLGRGGAAPLALSITQSLELARRLLAACQDKAAARRTEEQARIQSDARTCTKAFEEEWRTALAEGAKARASQPQMVDAKLERARARHRRLRQARQERLDREHRARLARLNDAAAAQRRELEQAHADWLRRATAEQEEHWRILVADWQRRTEPIHAALRGFTQAAEADFPPWRAELSSQWTPPAAFANAVKFARLEVDTPKLCDALPQDPRLAFPEAGTFSVPLVLRYPDHGSVLFETTKGASDALIAALNNVLFRLLAGAPPGKVSFSIIDPIKLGQNFAGVMHLADYEDNVINNRILTQASQIEERLGELNEHMEKVIQMYLRNEYPTIADYNRDAGNIAEKYHFVVVADFPANFSETAARRLLHIAASGAKCGVYTLIHWDHRHDPPGGFLPEELRKGSVCLQATGDEFRLAFPPLPGTRVRLDEPPEADLAIGFLHHVGEICRGSNRVEVPFVQVSPPADEVWSLETVEELRVPLGRSGATKLQYLALGKGTRQHALVAGKTGSGKSTLFHVLITNLSLWCSPEQVEFYLVDFKKGVEFKGYAARRLPHARVVAIESDREFGLSVLQRVDDELKRRGDLFRQFGVQDLPGYQRAGGREPLPRSLLLIDEFQEFFVEDDRISQAAAVLLDRIVRQGRAFGIHVLLGSQTLGGAYTLARTTIGQMVIRIALQCNEADAYLIMDENNAAPRLLTRPGEGIYNDMAGASEGNSPFQTVWLPDEGRDAVLQRVRALADSRDARRWPGPIVFEGNAPADIRENHLLRELLAAPAAAPAATTRVWLGAPNSIKGPTEAAFANRSGNNLLLVGQRDEAILALFSVALVALAAQHPRGSARFVVLESTAPGSPERDHWARLAAGVPHEISLVKSAEVGDALGRLADDLRARVDHEGTEHPTTYLLIHGLQNFKRLRPDEDFGFSLGSESDAPANAATQLQKLIAEGPAHGIHVLASVDTYNNVNRFLGRKLVSEFELRVLFQMSANDSSSLCDDPKASLLGLHRALLYNEQEGWLETFRPYAMPGRDWFEAATRALVAQASQPVS